MCGIFGHNYNPSDPPSLVERTIITTILADAMESRGRLACGYAYWNPDDRKVYFDRVNRGVMESSMLQYMPERLAMLGHTRFPTCGANTVDNAHPYYIGDIVGAQNGAVYNHMEIAAKYARNYEVDSMHLIAHIAEDKPIDELTGYGTVEWFDMRDPGAIYLCALKRGDLEVELLEKRRGVIWASTRTAIADALRSVGMYASSRSFNVIHGHVYRIMDGIIEDTGKKMAFKEEVYSHTTTYSYKDGSLKVVEGGKGPRRQRREPATFRDAYNGALPFGASPDAKDAYERACAAYNREAEELEREATDTPIGGVRTKMTKREKRRFFKLLKVTETHKSECLCPMCQEVFRLAAIEYNAAEHASLS